VTLLAHFLTRDTDQEVIRLHTRSKFEFLLYVSGSYSRLSIAADNERQGMTELLVLLSSGDTCTLANDIVSKLVL